MSERVFQAIVTSYRGPTNRGGSRIIARAQSGYVRTSYNQGKDVLANHRAAAETLANKFGWLDRGERLVAGGAPGGDGYVFVLIEKEGEL
jgi:hypothetical protein